ncbi:MAG: ATP-binding cassette domain-containing protein [Bacteroidota bacterium]
MTIDLKKVDPGISPDPDNLNSEVWGREISFSLPNKYLISAESGAGKSSLISFIYGERKGYEGDIVLNGLSAKTMTDDQWTGMRRNNLSLVFQGLKLFPELTALENIQLKNKLTDYYTESQIAELFDVFGLKHKMNEPAGLLSFGQRQRVAIIRALSQPFKWMLLDEPFSHIDEANIKIACDLIIKELTDRKAGMVLTSLGNRYSMAYDHVYNL